MPLLNNQNSMMAPCDVFDATPWKGFDELAEIIGYSKNEAKADWASCGHGLKRFPNTKFSNYFKPVLDDRGIVYAPNGRPTYECIKTWMCFDEDGNLLIFEKGRRTDLASIPALLFKFVRPDEDWIFWAAIAHDLRCEMKYPNKLKTDLMFARDILYFNGEPHMACLCFLAVSLGNTTWWTTTKKEALTQRINNQIASWEYIEKKEVYKVLPDVYRQQLSML